MQRKKIMLVFGTRPEAIKMAPLCHELRKFDHEFETLVCTTAQHRQMLDQALDTFDIRPDIDLNLMRAGQDLSDITASVLLGMRDVLREHQPDAVLVHGDTTTTMATTMAAFYAGIRLGHVEAGLRTHNLKTPFPEEFNRQLTGKLATWHFAPTHLSATHLLNEGVDQESIHVTGNTVIDGLFWILRRLEQDMDRLANCEAKLGELLPAGWKHSRYVLVTGHRRENFGDGFYQICLALRDLALAHPDTRFIYPVHLNPQVRTPVFEILQNVPNVHLLEPVSYEPFVLLLKHAHLVLTDSGGIQEEAPSLGKPVLVMRETTERPEALLAGTVKLVGASRERIRTMVSELLNQPDLYQQMTTAHNPFGDGNACQRIVAALRTSV